ncbi:MOB kinase activator 2-like isoform X1 [Acipenser ruthenus]|uniref:MOB kinase activator 2-like isoform X1 n=1 Tax=Acipenser ruthenus TaxID=7906 RepID=UPI00274097FE|nr:MOB kinase activator 2-like isoform X1 [Acipenser ruthenus]
MLLLLFIILTGQSLRKKERKIKGRWKETRHTESSEEIRIKQEEASSFFVDLSLSNDGLAYGRRVCTSKLEIDFWHREAAFFYITEHRKSKTKPNGKKPPTEEKKLYLETEYTKVRVTDIDLKELVMLPREIDLNEWLASNTTTFFNLINLQYSTISEFCTGETCQAMSACNTQYYWNDERGKKTKCTAPQYVDFVMSLVQKLVTDDDIFPTKYGKEFPNSFESLVKKICRYLFHVLAHIYWAHFKETVALDLQGHLNTLYAHFIVFIREFNLVDPKETSIMDDLSEVLCSSSADAQNHVKER